MIEDIHKIEREIKMLDDGLRYFSGLVKKQLNYDKK
jgi:hypothetical protein